MTEGTEPGLDPQGTRPPRRGVRGLALDTRPLRIRDFRLLWLGELVSETGSSVALVALYIQVYRLTHSALAVGLIGLVQVVPILLAALLGDRKSVV